MELKPITQRQKSYNKGFNDGALATQTHLEGLRVSQLEDKVNALKIGYDHANEVVARGQTLIVELEGMVKHLEQENADLRSTRDQVTKERNNFFKFYTDGEKQIKELKEDIRNTQNARSVLSEKFDKQSLELKRLTEALETVLKSAFPNPKDHPTMFTAWEEGRAALEAARGWV